MSERATRDVFTDIVEGQDHLTEAGSRLFAARAELVAASKSVDAAERYDVHAPVAAAIDAVDTAMTQLTADVAGE